MNITGRYYSLIKEPGVNPGYTDVTELGDGKYAVTSNYSPECSIPFSYDSRDKLLRNMFDKYYCNDGLLYQIIIPYEGYIPDKRFFEKKVSQKKYDCNASYTFHEDGTYYHEWSFEPEEGTYERRGNYIRLTKTKGSKETIFYLPVIGGVLNDHGFAKEEVIAKIEDDFNKPFEEENKSISPKNPYDNCRKVKAFIDYLDKAIIEIERYMYTNCRSLEVDPDAMSCADAVYSVKEKFETQWDNALGFIKARFEKSGFNRGAIPTARDIKTFIEFDEYIEHLMNALEPVYKEGANINRQIQESNSRDTGDVYIRGILTNSYIDAMAYEFALSFQRAMDNFAREYGSYLAFKQNQRQLLNTMNTSFWQPNFDSVIFPMLKAINRDIYKDVVDVLFDFYEIDHQMYDEYKANPPKFSSSPDNNIRDSIDRLISVKEDDEEALAEYRGSLFGESGRKKREIKKDLDRIKYEINAYKNYRRCESITIKIDDYYVKTYPQYIKIFGQHRFDEAETIRLCFNKQIWKYEVITEFTETPFRIGCLSGSFTKEYGTFRQFYGAVVVGSSGTCEYKNGMHYYHPKNPIITLYEGDEMNKSALI